MGGWARWGCRYILKNPYILQILFRSRIYRMEGWARWGCRYILKNPSILQILFQEQDLQDGQDGADEDG